MTSRTPWAAMLAAACGIGIPPARFWRLSLSEWRALTRPPQSALNREALDELAQRFPDIQS